MHPPGTACPEATEIMQRMWTDGVSRLDWVSAEDQNEVNLRNELQRGFTTPSLAHTAAALSKNGHGRAKVTVLDPTIGTGVLAASIVIRLAELPAAERPKWINVIGIDRNLKYCKAARTCLADLAGWAVNRGILVDTHVVTGDFLNPASWTGDIRGLSHEEINADIVVINPPHRPVRSKTREGNRIKEFKLLPSSTTEAAYIELATRAIADGGELIALSSARWMTDEDNSRAVRRLQKGGSITDIHLYRRQNISCSRLFGRNAQHLDATAWRYQKGAVGLPATSVFHETTGPDEPHGATIRVVTPHEMVLPTTGGNQHRQAIEIPRSRLDDEIQRILRNLPKLKNTGLHIARGRLSPYRERQRFTQDAGNEPVALITANNIVQAQSSEGTTWKLQWPSQRPNSVNYYNADHDSAPMNPIQPGSYVLITGPAGNAKEPCPRAALVNAERMGMPFVVTQQMHVIGMRAQDERVPAIAPLDDEHARGLATWLNSRLIRSHFRMNLKCGTVTGLLATRIPTPDNALLREIGRLATTESDAVRTVLQTRLTSAEVQAFEDNESIERAWEALRQKLGAGPKIANYAASAAIAAIAAHQADGHDGVAVDDIMPLIRKTFDIEFSSGSQTWFEQVMLPWAARTGATHTTDGSHVRLTERTRHALLPLAETEQRVCA